MTTTRLLSDLEPRVWKLEGEPARDTNMTTTRLLADLEPRVKALEENGGGGQTPEGEAVKGVARFLAVAGGGGGGGGSYNDPYYSPAAGGGAGGLLTGNLVLLVGATYDIAIGAGGVGGVAGLNAPANGSVGTATTIKSGQHTNIVALGGGCGVPAASSIGGDVAGGSGGGGGRNDIGASPTEFGKGATGQGNAGYQGRTGGGAGQKGAYAKGGDGLSSDITGVATMYAGGGGCGYNFSPESPAVPGGAGGGGHGARTASVPGDNGVDGLGGGGGGGSATTNGGKGGNGVSVLSIPTAIYSGVTTGNPTVQTVGTNTVLSFLNSGSYTA